MFTLKPISALSPKKMYHGIRRRVLDEEVNAAPLVVIPRPVRPKPDAVVLPEEVILSFRRFSAKAKDRQHNRSNHFDLLIRHQLTAVIATASSPAPTFA